MAGSPFGLPAIFLLTTTYLVFVNPTFVQSIDVKPNAPKLATFFGTPTTLLRWNNVIE
jgi:hypothetical protein